MGAALSCTGAYAQSLDHVSLEQLFGEPITTSVTGAPQRVADVPASMEIISAEDIRRSGARDLPGVLRHVAGVDVMQATNDHSDVSVRGYNQAFSSRLLVLVDGRQVYADYYGFTPWGAIPVELRAIRQIEVVRGPNSALFGFNAVGGVINIITYDPLNDTVSAASITTGTQDLVRASAVAGWQFGDNAGLRLSVGRRTNDDFATVQRPIDVGTRRGDERENLTLQGGLRVTDKVQVRLETSLADAKLVEFSPAYASNYATYDTASLGGSVAADTSLGLIEARIYTNSIKSDYFPGADQSPYFRFDNQVTVARVQSISKVANEHTLRLSAEHRENGMATTPTAGAEVLYRVDSVGSMWEWRIDPALTLTSALRLDHLSLERKGTVPPNYPFSNADWDRSTTEPSLNVGVLWKVSSTDSLRFTIGRGVQLPNLLNYGADLITLPADAAPPVGGFVSGIPTLVPTLVANYEAGWDRSLPNLNAVLRVSLFHGMTRHVVANSGGTDYALGLFVTPANIGDSDSTGLEVSIKGTVADRWRWGASYTPIVIEDHFDPAIPFSGMLVDYEHTTPRHVLNANLGWSRAQWEIDGFLRYQSEFDGIQSGGFTETNGTLVPISSYVSVDARVGYALSDRMTLMIAGQNLLNSEQQQSASANVERRLFVTFTVAF